MKLSSYFSGVAYKKLSAVETDPSTSNQHEFNGVSKLKAILGTDKTTLEASFIWFGESENETQTCEGFVTWYDARKDHPTRSEFRLYYQGNEVTALAEPGDFLIVAKIAHSKFVLVMVIQRNSVHFRQILWLFNINESESNEFSVQSISQEHSDKEVDYVTRLILEELGIDVEEPETYKIDGVLEKYILVKGFPSTKEFSDLARSSFDLQISPVEDPDSCLLEVMDWEERLFRRLERYIISERLSKGFVEDDGKEVDVDKFIKFSLSVQNRRKSRAGLALENHLEWIFRENNLSFDRGVITENRSKPDFIFPGISQYRNLDFLEVNLHMLGVKSTCKDRWRQVLSEANRIENKHLLTLEPGISVAQTNEMKSSKLTLVLPSDIQKTYQPSQLENIIDLKEFINIVG